MAFIGYIGLVILMLAFLIINTKYAYLFVPLDLIATILLFIHSYMIHDKVFLFMNGFIGLMLVIRLIKGDFTKTSEGC